MKCFNAPSSSWMVAHHDFVPVILSRDLLQFIGTGRIEASRGAATGCFTLMTASHERTME